VAMAQGEQACEKRHVVAAILMNDEMKEMLRCAQVDTRRMEVEIGVPFDMRLDPKPSSFLDVVPLGPDTEAVLRAGMQVQTQLADEVLSFDHFLSALCGDGEITVKPGNSGALLLDNMLRYKVDTRSIKEQVRKLREQVDEVQAESAEGHSGVPKLFGCFPLEEAIIIYAKVRIVFAVISFVFLLLGGKGGHADFYALRILEGIVCILCVAFNAFGLSAIGSHRHGRKDIFHAATSALARSGRDALELDLGKAFDVVREAQAAPVWVAQLKRGAYRLAWLLLWAFLELLLNIPILAVSLVEADVCKSYAHGISTFSSARLVPMRTQVQMHCTRADITALGSIGIVYGVQAYMCWAVLALWHEYAFGWTTTDLRGAAYLALHPFQEPLDLGERQPLAP